MPIHKYAGKLDYSGLCLVCGLPERHPNHKDKPSPHITLTVPRTLKGDDHDYTYYQSICSCGWSGDYKASKLTAQEDRCPNR